MAILSDEMLLQVLQACGQAAPEPLYPGSFAEAARLERDVLDEALDYLRLHGMVRLTDWVPGRGQGYTLTSEGAMVLKDPRLVQKRKFPTAPKPQPVRAAAGRSSWERGEAVRDALLDPARPVVTMTLLVLNLIVFLAGFTLAWQKSAGEEYLKGVSQAFGGNLQNPDFHLAMRQVAAKVEVIRIGHTLGSLEPGSVLAQDQWLRLLTYLFVHDGLLHLAMNMMFLYFVGAMVEQMWGSARFLFLYAVAGIGGGCAILLTGRGGVGASGALCGLLASFAVWVVMNRAFLPPTLVQSWMRFVLINGALATAISFVPGVSWEGHLGGAVGGALVSVPLNYHRFGSGSQKWLGLAGMIATPIAFLALVLFVLNPSRSGLTAQAQLSEPYYKGEAEAAEVYNKYVIEVLTKGKGAFAKEPALGGQAKDAFSKTRATLEDALVHFDQAGSFGNDEVDQAVRGARDYLEAWATFYRLLDENFRGPNQWNEGKRGALMDQLKKMTDARDHLEDTPILRPAYKYGERKASDQD